MQERVHICVCVCMCVCERVYLRIRICSVHSCECKKNIYINMHIFSKV